MQFGPEGRHGLCIATVGLGGGGVNVSFTMRAKFFEIIQEDSGQRGESFMGTPEIPQPVFIGRIEPGKEKTLMCFG
jgi:hypothetical protein